MGGSPHSLTGSGRSPGWKMCLGWLRLPTFEHEPRRITPKTLENDQKDRLIGLGVRYRSDYPFRSPQAARTASKRFDDDTTTLREGITSGNSLRKNKQARDSLALALRQLN
ncbi:hypothetical protein OIU79_020350 [Salix purpurea]|uniref:Uncharacterized protein n=1 Tax=Salix purpurea TaxID=77065 RepID=A0A9Q0NUA6_SALPP|nr:hypothetical protein OIU79_020350 [Salix purpurea]